MADQAPFPIDAEAISAVGISYKNEKMIADDVMPRVKVGKEEFSYRKQTMADSFTVPDTKVGRKSVPNEVEETGTQDTGRTQDRGLDDVVPLKDMENAPEGHDPLLSATEFVRNLVLLDREIRTASVVFDPNNHANKVTLSGTSQWSDYANSDPITAIMTALDNCVIRPNTVVWGQAVWTKVRQHPAVVSAILGNNGTKGIVTRQQLAELLELEEIIVGQGWVNTAKKGAAPTMVRVWGKHAAFLYREKPNSTTEANTWGFTAQFGDVISWADWEKKTGLKGSYRVRSGESVKEQVSAADFSYFFQNAVL